MKKSFKLAVLVLACVVAVAGISEAAVKKVKHAITVNMDDAGGVAAATMKDNIKKYSITALINYLDNACYFDTKQYLI